MKRTTLQALIKKLGMIVQGVLVDVKFILHRHPNHPKALQLLKQ